HRVSLPRGDRRSRDPDLDAGHHQARRADARGGGFRDLFRGTARCEYDRDERALRVAGLLRLAAGAIGERTVEAAAWRAARPVAGRARACAADTVAAEAAGLQEQDDAVEDSGER